MNVSKIFLSVFFLVILSCSSAAQKKASERLYMAKFLLNRLQPAELTNAQLQEIETISEATHKQILDIRKRTGITKEVMQKRDEVFNSLRDSGQFEKNELLALTAEIANLPEKEAGGFTEMAELKKVFTQSVMRLLTEEQKTKLAKAKKKKGKRKQSFSALDQDKNQFLTSNEIPNFNQDVFDQADNNIDNKLSEKEYKSYVHYAKRIAKNRALIPKGTQIFFDIAYIENGHERQKLDLYLPENSDSENPLPLVIWIHGGGWKKGSKQLIGHQLYLLSQGFAVASLNYRLSRTDIFPAQIHDCRAAVRFLRKNAKTYHLDSDNIGLWGSSAGGHLVSLMGTSNKKFDGSLGTIDVSNEVKAVCNWFGVTDFETMNKAIKSKPNKVKPLTMLLGESIENNPELARQASPITHVSDDTPPFLIMHGTADSIVPIEQSQIFYEKLTSHNIPVEYIIVEDWKHAFFKNEKELKQVAAFFSRYLK